MADRAANRVRERREARGLSQVALAERACLTRQSVGAIEAGRATPAVDVALRLARALDCQVEDLFDDTRARGAAAAVTAEADGPAAPGRAAMARIAGRWVAYPLVEDAARVAADGIVTAERRGKAAVEPLRALAEVEENVVMMGCAAGLGLLADRLNTRPGPGRFLWFPRSSTAALQALARQRAHVAGVHLVDARTGEANIADVRRLGHGEPIVLITLARWEAGLVVRREEAGRIRGVADLGRPGLRLVGREAGAGAQRLLEREVRARGLPLELARKPQLRVAGHLDVARAVAMGAADTGVATRDAAMAFGLGFVTLAEERYDLAVPREALTDARVQRLLDVLVSGEFRRELSVLGYDVRPAGERVAEVAAA
ncbi:substrate-binding domain-containing protein [Sorangium sp. So ce1151]|uniref:substrate-binding domain-containing protein n=1 Tax=Sorangium sp. So ce1151 TaxID=3133332 RepID=UPI003F5E8AAE